MGTKKKVEKKVVETKEQNVDITFILIDHRDTTWNDYSSVESVIEDIRIEDELSLEEVRGLLRSGEIEILKVSGRKVEQLLDIVIPEDQYTCVFGV